MFLKQLVAPQNTTTCSLWDGQFVFYVTSPHSGERHMLIVENCRVCRPICTGRDIKSNPLCLLEAAWSPEGWILAVFDLTNLIKNNQNPPQWWPCTFLDTTRVSLFYLPLNNMKFYINEFDTQPYAFQCWDTFCHMPQSYTFKKNGKIALSLNYNSFLYIQDNYICIKYIGYWHQDASDCICVMYYIRYIERGNNMLKSLETCSVILLIHPFYYLPWLLDISYL